MDNQFDFDKEIAEPLLDPELTKPARLIAAARRFLEHAHQAKRSEAITILRREFLPQAQEALSRDGRIDQLLADLESRLTELRSAPPAPTADSEIARLAPGLVNQGWSGLEIDFVRSWIQPGETLTAFDGRHVETNSGRSISRLSLRETSRPITWRNIESWNKQFERYPIDEAPE